MIHKIRPMVSQDKPAISAILKSISEFKPAEVVVANILAPVLIGFAANVTGSLAAGAHSRLVLAGILDTQYGAVRATYEAQGLVEIDSLLIGEWRSGLFGRGRPA